MQWIIKGSLVSIYSIALINVYQADLKSEILSDMSQDERVNVFVMSEYLSDPENVFSFGDEVGVVMNCPSIKGEKYKSLAGNSKNWLKIASLEFPGKLSHGGFMNSRKYKKLLQIFQKGLSKGQRDARMFKGRRDYKNGLCKELLEKGSDLYGPSQRLLKLIREN